jgi:hypothetical protein
VSRKVTILTVALLALAACGGSSDEASDRDESSSDSRTIDANDLDASDIDVNDLGACDDLEGQPTDTNLLVSMTYDCPDGRKLSWNDWGWGYSGDEWKAHSRTDGQLVPPQADLDACQQ